MTKWNAFIILWLRVEIRFSEAKYEDLLNFKIKIIQMLQFQLF